jgi:hypothetical protein
MLINELITELIASGILLLVVTCLTQQLKP